MAQVKFRRVDTLPGTLDAGTFYFVDGGAYAESYLTDSTGNAKAIGNSTMINALISAQLATLSTHNAVIVADIAARDAATDGLETNEIILVLDASADSNVGSGAALYIWEAGEEEIHLIAKYENLTLDVTWDSIQDKPQELLDAISQRHTHSNKATLDQIGADGDTLTFKGAPLAGGATEWAQTDW
jgi:hypothetical protein